MLTGFRLLAADMLFLPFMITHIGSLCLATTLDEVLSVLSREELA